MKDDHWQRLNELFHAALQHEPNDRVTFMDEVCAGDEPLRRELEALLYADERAISFIERPAFRVEAMAVAAEHHPTQDVNAIVGQTIDHYRIIKLLSVGGMGDVYLAQDTTLVRRVALKILPTQFTSDPERVLRFEQEARAASALNHPNILTIYEVRHSDSLRYIVSEFIDGVTLRERMAGKPMKPGDALEVALQITSALAAAHAKGIIHRDVKPENIMITEGSYSRTEACVKVLDFGIAKLSESDVAGAEPPAPPTMNTSQGITMGTTYYMSPEQVRAERVDTRTDIWSLGAVLYEMLTGKLPFTGNTSEDVRAAILKDEVEPIGSEVPEPLSRIVGKALRKERDRRYQTAPELFADLRDLQVRAMQSSANSAAPSVSSSENFPGRIRQSRGALLFAIFTLLIVGVAISFYKLRAGSQPVRDLPFHAFQAIKLTVTGKSRGAAISPDGKTLAYIVDESERQSMWLRNISNSSEVQIVPPEEVELIAPTFSPDGGNIYFLKRNKNELLMAIYRVPALGGVSNKLIEDVDSSVGFSPDGEQIAFTRQTGDKSNLMIANADGSAVRSLAARSLPARFVDEAPAWSKDAQAIYCAVSIQEGSLSYDGVIKVRTVDGAEEPFSSKRWEEIQNLARLKDNGLVVVSGEQIWHLSPEGEARRLIDDSNKYEGVNVSSDGRTMVAVQNEGQAFNIWVRAPDASTFRQITTGIGNNGGATWTPDGRLLYTSNASGKLNIWIMNEDGSNPKQLTATADANYYTSITDDGRYIVFISTQSGTPAVWRMDADGGNARELATTDPDPWPYCSPDGKWVVYQSQMTLWRVPLDGGESIKLTDGHAGAPAISPDGKLVACIFFEAVNSPAKLGILHVEGGPPVKLFNIPVTVSARKGGVLRWSADGRAVTYIDTRGGVSNIWSQPLDGGASHQITDFKSERIAFFNWSRNGKGLAITRGSSIRDLVLIKDSGA